MTYEITDGKALDLSLDGINELIVVNERLGALFEYKRDEYLDAVFPFRNSMSPEEFRIALNELFDAEDSRCTMNDQPVPIKFALLSSKERFLFQLNAKEKGFQNWEIYAMRKAIGIDSLIGII